MSLFSMYYVKDLATDVPIPDLRFTFQIGNLIDLLNFMFTF